MFVCQCEAVTYDEVVAVVDGGAVSVEAVGRCTGAGTGCGICQDSIETIVAERCGSCPLAGLAVA